MRLTWKLSLAVSLGVLLVLAGHAALRVSRDLARFLEEVRGKHHAMARALAIAVEHIAIDDGAAAASDFVADVDREDTNIELRWVSVEGDHPASSEPGPGRVAGAFRSVETRLTDDEPTLISHLSFTVGERLTAIEIVEPLRGRPERVREAIARTASTTAVVVVLCAAIILGFGVTFVARPLGALADHARRLARGERGVRTLPASRDEIGQLAGEMNTMSDALDQARARVRDEGAARIEALAQLRQADRLRAVGEMASSIAHDLGTPMASVRARAQMVAGREVSPDRAVELAAEVVGEVDRMSATIRRLLEHGRRSAPRLSRVELRPWALEALELLRPVADRYRIELCLEAEDNLVGTLDAAQMRHVLVNLLANGIDASPGGGVVTTSMHREPGELVIEVSDAGEGIPRAHLADVFEPFFTTKEPGAGSGLGLSVARGIVEEHGGSIEARASSPRGTNIVVRIPQADSATASASRSM